MIELIVGLPGQGKSLVAAKTVLELLERNEKWNKKTEKDFAPSEKRPYWLPRRIASNMPFSPSLEEKWPDRFKYWTTLDELVKLENVDVIFDEVANQFDARNWQLLADDVKRWLRHHDKDGIEVYANTQHYEAVDVQFRRLVNRLYVVRKLIGSPRPAATKPIPKRIWGVCYLRQHDPKTYAHESDTGDVVKSAIGIPSPFFIHKKYVDAYDTTYKIEGDKIVRTRHIIKKCSDCGHETIAHV
jgi:hypothetical protein